MLRSNYEVQILVNGHSVQEFFHENKNFIEGRKNNEFSIRIKNNGSRKIVAIPSVDGLSVMDGKEASENSRGYVINGHDSITIDGWRISDSEVNKFFFTDVENSYAQRKKEGENIGVIGVMIFREKESEIQRIIDIIDNYPKKYPKFPDDNKQWTGGSTYSLSACSAQNNVFTSQEVGVGWGEEKLSSVISVSFDREFCPDAVFEIYYNSRKQLEKSGIDFSKRPQYVTPRAFNSRYCEPPQNS